ncbi:MAG TPA: glutathione S-transferase family protein [Paracoccaceae bacterium]
MYVLHYAPDNASLIVRLALEEAGLPYRTALVNRATRQQDSAAYRALNPTGLIPVLETPEGALFETGAILLWLADRTGGLAPAPADPARGDFLKWLFFLSNTAHADLRRLFYPGEYVPAGAEAGHHAIMAARMQRHFALLDAAAQAQPQLFAAPSVLALYVAALMRWSVLYPEGQDAWFRLADFPALASVVRALEARPAVTRAAAAEGLGRTPFTAPEYACPPEGSAT